MRLKNTNATLFGLFLLFFLLNICSCVPYRRLINLHQVGENAPSTATYSYTQESYKIKPGDLLDITVNSTDQNSVAIFNKQVGQSTISGGGAGEATFYLRGYQVSDSGYVEIPLLGKVLVAGKELSQLTEDLEKTLSEYYKFVSVTIKMLSFRVTVLGEVPKPGTYLLYNQKTNLFQLMGMVGGTNDVALKTQVKFIRKMKDGSIKLEYIDVTNTDIINTPYFYLQPDDVLIFEPRRVKAFRTNSSTYSFFISIATFTLFAVNIYLQLK